jgi:VanZ family protein
MHTLKRIVPRWFPALLVMSVIFLLSSQPSENLLNLGWADRLFKKGGHLFGYGLLALSYWNGFGFERGKRPFAWALAMFYAGTDEFHQSFVAGRNPSIWDVLVFDNLGALMALLLAGWFVPNNDRAEASDR